MARAVHWRKREYTEENSTESFECLRLNSEEFYLVMLPLEISWALMKYHMKPLGMTKAQDFHQNLYDLLLHSQTLREHFGGMT